MIWMVAAAQAADAGAPVVIHGDRDAFEAHQSGTLTPGEFAGAVGDDAVAEAYRRAAVANRRYKVLGWSLGAPLFGVGAIGFVASLAEGEELPAAAASMVMWGGGMTLATCLTIYLAQKNELNRLERWYGYDHAVALAGAAFVESPEHRVRLVHADSGTEAWREDERLTAEQFAEVVGDARTYRRSRSLKVLTTTTGIALLVVGSQGMSIGASGLEDGQLSDPEVAFGTAGVLSTATGAVLLVIGRRIYTDMDTWYTYSEAEAALGG